MNPFDEIKASLFTPDEIQALWVDPPNGVHLMDHFKPRLQTPMYVVGGKGCGKTHLMRHCSFDVQRLRAFGRTLIEQVQSDGYVGFWLLLNGLNAGRFDAKGQSEDTWAAIFEFYVEIWFGQLVLTTVKDVCRGEADFCRIEPELAYSIAQLFDRYDAPTPDTLDAIVTHLRQIQRRIDLGINNCSLTGQLDLNEVEVVLTRGSLVFGAPQLIARQITSLSNVAFLYLIDELENLNERQQRYIATLVRDQMSPCTLKIGARRHGIRTYRTYSADEENKEGSEFVQYDLDTAFRGRPAQYERFVRHLCALRILRRGLVGEADLEVVAEELDNHFAATPRTRFGAAETSFVFDRHGSAERAYFRTLRRQLKDAHDDLLPAGRTRDGAVNEVISLLRVDDYPLLEKFNIYRLFTRWATRGKILDAAEEIRRECEGMLSGASESAQYEQSFEHHRDDLFAQLLSDYNEKQRYTGFRLFAKMSDGFPRNLLMILQKIYHWAEFNGESPFQHGKISEESQIAGAREASDWFFRDALLLGGDGPLVRDAIARLADVFRLCRFSDKPTEASVIQFSVDVGRLTPAARRAIEVATQWSLLVEMSRGQRDRNDRRVEAKFQLNRMLSPRWDLPVFSKGTMSLSGDDASAIFDPSLATQYENVVRSLRSRLNAPGFGRRGRGRGGQESLPGL